MPLDSNKKHKNGLKESFYHQEPQGQCHNSNQDRPQLVTDSGPAVELLPAINTNHAAHKVRGVVEYIRKLHGVQ